MRKLVVAIAVMCAALLVIPAAYAAKGGGGGNSDSAKACYQGGWQNLYRSPDGSAFANQGDCVSYAAKGGTFLRRRPSAIRTTTGYRTPQTTARP